MDTYRLLNMLVILTISMTAASALAETETCTASPSGIVDVTLTPDGHINGWLLENDGHAIAGAVVILAQRGSAISQVVTDSFGRYELQGVKMGVYQLQAGDQACVIRVWDAATAPPAARDHLTLIRENTVIRGQSNGYAPSFGGPRGLAGIGMVGVALGTLTVVGIESTQNDNNNSLSLGTTMPPGGTMPLGDTMSP